MVKYAPHTMSSAADRAEAKVGHSNEVGMCAHEVIVNVFGIPAPWYWGGNGRAWAVNYFKGAKERGRVVETSDPKKIPRGAMVFWDARPGATTTGGKAGHVAVGAGDGYCYSTDLPREGKWGKVKISDVERLWGKKLLGYVLVDGMGYTLTDKPAEQGTVDFLDPKNYPDAAHPKRGIKGPQITWLGQKLVKHGFTKHHDGNGYQPGPTWTEDYDRENVRDFQLAQGWKGANADGYVGPETLRRLAAEPPTPDQDAPAEPKTVELTVLFTPLAGYNDEKALGVTNWEFNTDATAAIVGKVNPDAVGTTEVSNHKANPMLPRLTSKLGKIGKGIVRLAGGTDGRYWFRNRDTMNSKASGNIECPKSILLNGDTKQAAWYVGDHKAGARIGFIVGHTENQDGRDTKTGKDANDLRVDQALHFLTEGEKRARENDADVLVYVLDGNSVAMVREALEKKGHMTVGAPGYFVGWKRDRKKPFDLAAVKSLKPGVKVSIRTEHHNNPGSDHTYLVAHITITFA